MRRLTAIAAILLTVASACASNAGDTTATDVIAPPGDADPITAFCDQWPGYAQFVDSVEEPTEELVAELLEIENHLSGVLPDKLDEAWRGVVDWNTPFLELLERIGYQPITDEIFLQAFDGNEERAAAAAEARETGFETISAWVELNCGAATTGDAPVPFAFCAAWARFGALTADDAELDGDQFAELQAVIDEVSDGAPAAVAEDWSTLLDFVDRYATVMVSVEFQADRITDGMLEQAFGSVEEYDRIVVARDAAGGAITEWAREGCGGFCSRWSDTREALDHFLGDLGWVADSADESPRRFDELEGRLVAAGDVVDEGMRADWDTLTEAMGDWVGLWSSFDFDRQGFESAIDDGRLRELIADSSYIDGIVETMRDHHLGDDADMQWDQARDWLAGNRQAPDWLSERVGDPERWLREAFIESGPNEWLRSASDRMEGWVEVNCAASSGGPGTFRVRYPRVDGHAGSTVVLGLLPVGGQVGDLADVPEVIAGWCEQIGRDPWSISIGPDHEQAMESGFFRDERWREDGLCDFHHEDEPPLIAAGTYTLVGGIMWGSPGDPSVGFDLSSCVAIDVTIASETIVDLPPFEPCEVRLGDSDADPWRHSLEVDPTTPGVGTLQIELDSMAMQPPFEEYNGNLEVVVLQAGTTLNQVGRQQIWPVGAVSAPLVQERHVDPRLRSVRVPVAALPDSGRPIWLDTEWLAQGPPPDRLPLTLLAPGAYDVYVEIWPHIEDAEEQRLCGQTEVVIDGDVVIDLPELGPCP